MFNKFKLKMAPFKRFNKFNMKKHGHSKLLLKTEELSIFFDGKFILVSFRNETANKHSTCE
jgi:hypothetical protein